MSRLSHPSTLLAFLEGLGIRPKKGLSQNFLIDSNVVSKVIDTAKIEAGDVVLEIGPGPGVLTEELLLRGAHVLAVEKDEVLGQALRRLQTEDERLEIHIDDALELDIPALLKRHLKKGQKAKIVSNLPYQISTPILAAIAPLESLVSDITVLVQDEFARRAVARPGGKEMGSLTVFLGFFGDVHYAFKVTRHCFYPAPKIDSAVINYQLRPKFPDIDSEVFLHMTRSAYQQRRKMIRRSLREIYSLEVLEEACAQNGLSADLRPEQLSVENWIGLFRTLHPSV